MNELPQISLRLQCESQWTPLNKRHPADDASIDGDTIVRRRADWHKREDVCSVSIVLAIPCTLGTNGIMQHGIFV
jgi:hypothetical protein